MALGNIGRNTAAACGRALLRLRWLAVASALLCLAACPRQSPLVVGVHPWIGYEPLYLAREFNWLPPTIQFRESRSASDSLALLKSGEAVAACITLDEMLRARAQGLPLSVAVVFDISAGADAVLARPEIKTPGDLAKKRIAFDKGALGALIFERLLEEARLPASAVVQVDLPPERQIEAWRKNEIDAVITYEPMASAFLREGAHTLLDSRRMPDTIIDVLAVRRDRPEALPLVRALVASHFRALNYLRANEQDALYRIAARQGSDPAEVRRMLTTVMMPSAIGNRAYLWGADSRLRLAAAKLSASMVRQGLLAHDDDLSDLILPDMLPNEKR